MNRIFPPTLLLACIVSLIPSTPLLGQSRDRGLPLLELPVGARATGLGAAQVGASDPDLFRLHPALVGASTGMQMSWSRLGPDAEALTLSTARSWYGGRIRIGLGVETLDYRGRVGLRSGGLGSFVNTESDGIAERTGVLTIGTELFGIDVGATGRLAAERVGEDRASRGLLDVGAATRVGPARLALSVRGLGPTRVLDDSQVDPPTEVLLGAGAWGRPLGPLDVGFAAEVGRRADGELRAGGGLEFGYWPIQGRTFVGRVGMRHVPDGDQERMISVGASYWGDDLILSWGWRPVEGEGGLHTFTLGWR